MTTDDRKWTDGLPARYANPLQAAEFRSREEVRRLVEQGRLVVNGGWLAGNGGNTREDLLRWLNSQGSIGVYNLGEKGVEAVKQWLDEGRPLNP